MPDTLTTPLMGMTLPVPGARLGPQWAVDLNTTGLGVVDGHDHTPGKGPKIPPAGLDITDQLDFQDHDGISLRSVRFTPQSAPLAGVGDVGCLYESTNDLYFNDGLGHAVRITNGGALDVSGLTPNVWGETSVALDLTIVPGNTFIVLLIDTTAVRNITLPSSAAVAAGRFYLLKDISGLSETSAINLIPAGGDTIDGASGTFVLRANYGAWFVINDGAGHWELVRSGAEVNGASVPRAGSLTTDAVLRVTGSRSLAYGPINLASSAAVTGVLDATHLGLATSSQTGAVQLAGDLAGTGSSATAPRVSGVTGVAGTTLVLGSSIPSSISLLTSKFQFAFSASSPKIGVDVALPASTPQRLKIYGSDHDPTTTGIGGGIDYAAGTSHGAISGDGNISGDHRFTVGGNPLLHLAETVTGRTVVALGNSIASSDVSSGNRFVWIGNANVVPSTSSASGAILYASAGGLGIIGPHFTLDGTSADAMMSADTSATLRANSFPIAVGNVNGGVLGVGGLPTTTDKPLFSGDGVIWLKNATTAPSAGASTAAILFATAPNPGVTPGRFGFGHTRSDGTRHSLEFSNEVNVSAGSLLGYVRVFLDGSEFRMPIYNT
jgi:hypothetical protein